MPELAAAYLADTFFKQPNIAGFKDKREATEKLECWEAVRACLLNHLQTGKRPDTSAMDTADAWPLPRPEVSWPLCGTEHWRTQFPLFSLLIDIAILENRLDDAVRLNAERPRNRYSSRIEWSEVFRQVIGVFYPYEVHRGLSPPPSAVFSRIKQENPFAAPCWIRVPKPRVPGV